MKSKTKQHLLYCLAVIMAIVIVIIVIHDYLPELKLFIDPKGLNQAKLEAMVRSHGFKDVFLLGLIIMIMNAIPGLSNAVVCVVAGICYGPVLGFLINWIGNFAGNLLSTYALTKVKIRFKSKRIAELMANGHPEVMMTIGYMIPFIPSVGLNYSAVVRQVPLRQHVITMMIGMVPTALLYAIGGDAILKVNWKRILIVAIIIVMLIGVNWLLYLAIKKRRHPRSLS